MKISIIAVGKIKEKYLKQGIDEYKKRLSSYAKLQIIEVPDEKTPDNINSKDAAIVKDKEGERILSHIHPDSHVITLEINGKMRSSEQLAKDIENLSTYGKSHITFIIGGSLGLSQAIQNRSNDTWSFSKLTFPHQLMRLMLLEQVYRGFRIIRGEPYHK
ncbi:23S rRNA (pseudouridine(1915)-N(3))-methyltransferase RlmH [Ornithinibacillus gellani]|uniref:23S rRNA (pseudouridine(1915)-N(3))-methyltransferase RlmH n=1 Tax=Ornithinibacillus gellani TaxID=2293253 RepID=UPI000F4A8B3F|nr:23S rRNA (pseudouridine(1915)-N(3))-methyltransferase RlmH [Ornithinibacillus gellani]TQS76304.1 23S rRNA (pseudouridine(1915)-N(3))-methyltransferase RlmH [Ornithinibacillus gellani]